MNLKIVEIHPAKQAGALNSEWFVVENTGDTTLTTKNCTVSVSRGNSKKRKELGTIDPGFTIAPGEKVRLVTGNPGRKAHGEMPPETDKVRNYSLFLGASVLQGPGTVVHFSLRSHPIAKAVFDPAQKQGIGADPDKM
jgi:hypothetical protein